MLGKTTLSVLKWPMKGIDTLVDQTEE